MHGIRLDDRVLRVDQAAGGEVGDVQVVDLVLLVRHPRRVGERGGLELGRRGARRDVPVGGEDVRREGVELLDVLGDAPAGRAPALVDEVVDFVAELEEGQLVAYGRPESCGLRLGVGPVAAVVDEVEGEDEVCSGGEVVCERGEPRRCDVAMRLNQLPPFIQPLVFWENGSKLTTVLCHC